MSKSRDLYQILGIRRDATLDQIQFAFRQAAKRAHPDCQGSSEEFAAICRARDVLSDPRLRLTYDQTGEVNEPQVDTLESEALGLIDMMLNKIIDRRTAFTLDLIADMANEIDRARHETQTGLAKIKTSMNYCERLAGRFKAKKGQALIKRMILTRKDAMAKQIVMGEHQLEVLAIALGIVRRHEFVRDVSQAMFGTAQRPVNNDTSAWNGLAHEHRPFFSPDPYYGR